MDAYTPSVGLLSRNADAAERAWLSSGSISGYKVDSNGNLWIYVPGETKTADDGFTILTTNGNWKMLGSIGNQNSEVGSSSNWLRIIQGGLTFFKMKNKPFNSGPIDKTFRQPLQDDPIQKMLEEMREKEDKIRDTTEVLLELIKEVSRGGTTFNIPLVSAPQCLTNGGAYGCGPSPEKP
jgi:hypothetical protein